MTGSRTEIAVKCLLHKDLLIAQALKLY